MKAKTSIYLSTTVHLTNWQQYHARRLVKVSIKCLMVVTVFAGMILNAQLAHGQIYPSKPITMIVNFPPGGPTDVVARLVSTEMSKTLGQPVIVQNIVGASGNIGARAAQKAAPDGYTVIANSTSMMISPLIDPQSGYTLAKDFSAVGLIYTSWAVMVRLNSFAPKTISEAIALAKAKPGSINFGIPGKGTVQHIGLQFLKKSFDIDIVNVPYKGEGPLITALLGGEVHMAFISFLNAGPLVKSGRLSALAIPSSMRIPQFPDVPTLAESGVPGLQIRNYTGLHVPAGTPPTAIAHLNSALVNAIRLPHVQERLYAMGVTPEGSTPAEHEDFIAKETALWTKVLKVTGINFE